MRPHRKQHLTAHLAAAALAVAAAVSAQQPATMDPHMVMDRGSALGVEPAPAFRVDSVGRVVFITVGPFSIEGMAGMPMSHHTMRDHVIPITWPVDAYLNGFGITIHTADGTPMPSEMMHHAGMANLGRRDLLFPKYQRLFAASKETAPVQLPQSIGVPLHRGDSLALFVMLHSPSGESVKGVYLTYRLPITFAARRGNPVAIWPMYFDVAFVPGLQVPFDLPPGVSTHEAEFTMPATGRLLAVGGHVHDYARSLRFVDCASGKTLVLLKAHRRKDGTVTGLDRFIFGFHDEALRLERGHRYRLIATYDNPTGGILLEGGMGQIGGPLELDDIADWPALDSKDPLIRLDRETM